MGRACSSHKLRGNMGGKASCISCDPSSRREVLVMKEDGELLRFKEETRVKDVLAANPYHKVIRCCSERTVLEDSFQLSCNQFYFLLPQGLTVSDETYESLIRLAASRNSNLSALSCRRDGENSQPSESNTSKILSSKDDPGNTSSRWKPALKTIPEANSPLPTLQRLLSSND